MKRLAFLLMALTTAMAGASTAGASEETRATLSADDVIRYHRSQAQAAHQQVVLGSGVAAAATTTLLGSGWAAISAQRGLSRPSFATAEALLRSDSLPRQGLSPVPRWVVTEALANVRDGDMLEVKILKENTPVSLRYLKVQGANSADVVDKVLELQKARWSIADIRRMSAKHIEIREAQDKISRKLLSRSAIAGAVSLPIAGIAGFHAGVHALDMTAHEDAAEQAGGLRQRVQSAEIAK